MTAAKTVVALFLCALLSCAQAVFSSSALASCAVAKKHSCCCKSPSANCQCGCEVGNTRTPSQPAVPLPATASAQSVIDALAQQVAFWMIAPAASDLIYTSPARFVSFPSGAPLYVRFCAQLI